LDNINYRKAQLEDLPILYEFEQGIVETERPFDSTLIPGHINYYDINAMILGDDVEVLVAEVNSEIVGSGYVKIKDAAPYLKFEKYAFVGFLFVKPAFRRKGISQEMIKHMSAWARTKGLNEMRLGVYDENHGAVAAYEKIGMKKHTVVMRMEI